MRIVKKFVTAHADLDGEIRMRIVKKFRSSSSSSVVSIYPHRLLAFSQNVRPGEGSVPTGPTTGKLQSLMTSRAEKGTQDLMR